jgi:voltage-gated potassium channel Kch
VSRRPTTNLHVPSSRQRLLLTLRLLAERGGRVGTVFGSVFVAVVTALWLIERDAPAASITSWPRSLWFCTVTMATVGYGDAFPVTTAGRVLTGLFILFTLVSIGFVLTAINEAVLEVNRMEELGLIDTDLRGHTVVVGYSPVARTAIQELLAVGRAVAVVCERAEDIAVVRRLGDGARGTLFVTSGEPDVDFLRVRMRAAEATTAVVATADDARNIIASLNLRAVHPGLRIIVAVQAEALRQTLIASGVTYVASPFELSGRLVASAAFEPEVAHFVEDVTSGVTGHDLQQYSARPFVGQTVAEVRAALEALDGPLLVGVARWSAGAYTIEAHPRRTLTLQPDDQLIVLASRPEADRLHAAYDLPQGR